MRYAAIKDIGICWRGISSNKNVLTSVAPQILKKKGIRVWSKFSALSDGEISAM